jgi:hypothetical protein
LALKSETQYQLTAKVAGKKASQPFLFTTIVPTVEIPFPSVTAPAYTDTNYILKGVIEPHATFFFYI